MGLKVSNEDCTSHKELPALIIDAVTLNKWQWIQLYLPLKSYNKLSTHQVRDLHFVTGVHMKLVFH